jgi:hypothetical protein
MHTLKIILAGLLLLAGCLGAGHLLQARGGLATAALVFLPLWLVGALINMWFGVARAGYPLREEWPMLIVVFGVPAIVALGIWWFAHGRA